MNKVEVYQKNSIEITCTVSGISSLSGYSASMMVKKYKDDADDDAKFTANGNISGLVITFTPTPTNNDLPPGDYWYEITITDGAASTLTVQQDVYRVLDRIKD